MFMSGFKMGFGGGGEAPPLVSATIPINTEGASRLATVTSSPAISVTVVGGSGNFTYAWSRVSGATTISATSSTAATTAFQTSFGATYGTRTAVFKCRVTDTANGTFIDSNNVSITLTREE